MRVGKIGTAEKGGKKEIRYGGMGRNVEGGKRCVRYGRRVLVRGEGRRILKNRGRGDGRE